MRFSLLQRRASFRRAKIRRLRPHFLPPSAILLGVLFLGERLALSEFAGMALIGFGLVILDGRAYRLLAKAA
jgi:drug/metabolite transporter (DMT)-like permease